MTEPEIRTATLADLPTLYEFEQGIIAFERPFDPTLKPDKINYYDLKAFILSDEAEVVVAEIENEIVGSAYVRVKNAFPYLRFKTYAFVGFMFVKPNFRGRSIAKKIIEKLKVWSKSKGLSEMRLTVYDDNPQAIRAYEKAGMKKHIVEMRMSI